jgi:kynureninase
MKRSDVVGGAVDWTAQARELDMADPLAEFAERFVAADPDVIYLNGNSLGRLPLGAVARLREVVEQEWGRGLVGSWSRWITQPQMVGDLVGRLVGAAQGQVLVCDSTSVNLYKLASAALAARPGRPVLLTDAGNFPTDRYVLESVARAAGGRLVLLDTIDDVSAAVDEQVAVVSLSLVSYLTGALADMRELTQVSHAAGALVLWDLSHAVGAVSVELDALDVDLAVGCTYKYLNAGPGSPAFLYVRRALQAGLQQPIWGWFGQRDQFAMGAHYDPAPDLRRFLAGSPDVLGLAAVAVGAEMVLEAGIDRVQEKGRRLGDFLITLADAWLAPLGFGLASPRAATQRGMHVSLRHPSARPIAQAVIERGRVIVDFRMPDLIRFGLSPLTTSFGDVCAALESVRDVVASGMDEATPVGLTADR